MLCSAGLVVPITCSFYSILLSFLLMAVRKSRHLFYHFYMFQMVAPDNQEFMGVLLELKEKERDEGMDESRQRV
ncbi:hypothetical protein SAMN02745131_01995 [Flavisolibacter ginsengisoli DSM 18119]|uniref:Uncharacterized protein n=1 Tax=Flavisolibacter ginsengisoli DSM 18119 TaxID=1121884 RepID=A0A1M4ZLZ0_9BACT|nr:hypothetical protein SAMN02745131_01995 [Flavisolibacter ginsengisoli DSM 18119]